MARPIVNSYHHIHQAIGGELLKLEEHARNVDPASRESVGGFAGHLAMLKAIQEAHSHEEEEGFWPLIEQRIPGATASFLFDHEAERRYFDEIEAALAELQSGGDKQDAARRLYRYAVTLSSHLIHHMAKEEAQPYSQFADRLSEQEEAAIIHKVYEDLPAEMLQQAMPWWASYQSPEDIAEEADTLLSYAPPEKARMILSVVTNSLPPEKWSALKGLRSQLVEYRTV
jgi:iron-sulfur cluster repair protein YtfE (RIC family)